MVITNLSRRPGWLRLAPFRYDAGLKQPTVGKLRDQLTRKLDNYLSGRYQACALNYNAYLVQLFGKSYALDEVLAFSIQFADLDPDQAPKETDDALPKRIKAYVTSFDAALTHDEYNSPKFAYRLLFKRKLVNRPGQADKVIEFIDPNSEAAKAIDKEYWVKKEVERPKFRAKDVAEAVRKAGFPKFKVFNDHLNMWRAEDARNPAKGFGTEVQGTWYWYESWVTRCIELCAAAGDRYK